MRTKVYHYYEECFRAPIYLLCPIENNAILPTIKRICGVSFEKPAENCDANAIAVSNSHQRYYFIAMRRMNRSVLVHECVHVANFILQEREVPISIKEDEVQAYLVEEIYRNLSRLFKQPRKEH